MKVKITDKLNKKLRKAGADDSILRELAKAIISIPRQDGLDVDTSDNMIKCFNIPVSFIRDHKKNRIFLMTNAEALRFDEDYRLMKWTEGSI